jgi:nitric oxide reductase subunit B
MRENRRLWIGVGLVIFAAFFILGWFGREVYRNVPPIPERVKTDSGKTLLTREDILDGQQV